MSVPDSQSVNLALVSPCLFASLLFYTFIRQFVSQ